MAVTSQLCDRIADTSYEDLGVPAIEAARRLVLDGIAVAAKAAEMALALKRLTGSVVSRRGTYAKASAACIEEFLSSRW